MIASSATISFFFHCTAALNGLCMPHIMRYVSKVGLYLAQQRTWQSGQLRILLLTHCFKIALSGILTFIWITLTPHSILVFIIGSIGGFTAQHLSYFTQEKLPF